MDTAHALETSMSTRNAQAARVSRAVGKAVAIVGSEVKLAAACGVTQPAISKAKLQGRISANLALAVHRATDGRVSASELRPDLWLSPKNVPIAILGRRRSRSD